jgi:hypothetical protein
MIALVIAIATVALTPTIAGGQANADTIVWACPRHPDQLSRTEGKCPVDSLPLEAVHLNAEWTCPEHPAIAQDEGGKCPICRRDLIQVETTRYYTCPQSTLHELEPGNCADGEIRTEVRHRISAPAHP